MRNDASATGRFTGRHMLAIMVAFFGTIIAVNVTLAMFANRSWTGLVVKNSYVASQEFNGKVEEGRRQAALGFTPTLSIDGGALRFTLADAAGAPVTLAGGEVLFRRPASDREDRTLTLVPAGDALEARADLADGVWIVEINADVGGDAGLDAPWRQTRRLMLRGGTLR